MPKKHLEADIQIAICEYLSLIQEQKKLLFFAVPNEAFSAGKTRGQWTGADFYHIKMARRMGQVSGTADLVIVTGGDVIFLEVKSPKGRLSPRQVEFRNLALWAGAEYHIVRSVDDVKKVFDERI